MTRPHKQPETATLIFWTAGDGAARGTADHTGTVTVDRRDALFLAETIEAYGHRGILCAERWDCTPNIHEGHHAVAGHGVTITYASGYRRHIHSVRR